tara:strand:- start:2694 stop:3224 length:531 start_codon:yes stop_codon:yes gene_type:complete
MNENDFDMNNVDPTDLPEDTKYVEEEAGVMFLTRNEALFIDDSLSMIIEREPHEDRVGTVRPMAHTAGLPAPVNLLEKIGKAILFTTDPDNQGEPAEVSMSETDLYMLREITHSYIKIGEEAVGFNLKRKIYTLLYNTEYERDKIANRLIAQVDIPTTLLEDDVPVSKNARSDLDI